nr:hypothetical protein [Planctomycetota bacterium]
MGALVALASVLTAFLLVSIRGFPRGSALLGAVSVVSAAVFLALVAFVHPSGDDYDFALALRGGGPWSVVSQFYHQWSGRFSAILVTSVVTSLHPLAWACRSALIAVVVIEAAALAAIIRVGSARSVSRAQAAWVALVVMCVCAGSMPSTAEGLYWMSAVLGYGLGFAVLL